jgi:acyl-CoA thioesterase FadM
MDTCSTPFQVLPSDLDVLRHMNNGVYFSVMDLARADLMMRCGLAGRLRQRHWYPVVAAQTIRFRRSLTLFQRFTVESRVLGWDDRAFLVEQLFVRDREPVASAVVRARFLGRKGERISPQDVLALVGLHAASPPLPVPVARWSAEQAA